MARPRLDDPELPLSELMAQWPETVAVFNRRRMLCVGCLVSPFHTIVDCCREYDLDETAFLAELMHAAAVG